MTDVDICNLALIDVGAEKITALNENNKRAILANTLYAIARDSVLQDGGLWNFAVTRLYFSFNPNDILFSDVSVAGDSFTKVGHGFFTGQKIQVSSNDTLPAPLVISTDYFVVFVDSDTFKLATSLVNALAGTVINLTTQGAGTHTLTPQEDKAAFEFSYKYRLPSDCLKTFRLKDDPEYKIENGFILTNDSSIYIRYIRKETDTTKFTPAFTLAVAKNLAYMLSYPMVQSASLKQQLLAEYQLMISKARSLNAQESSAEELYKEYYTVESRF